MRLTLIRNPNPEFTPGVLYIDDKRFCDTLEDLDRGLTQTMTLAEIKKIKVFGETCIPYGVYKVLVNYSIKFKRQLPYLVDVPGFTGIRVHGGRNIGHTHGCVLVGISEGTERMTESQKYLEALIFKLNDALKKREEVTIEIIKQTLL